jgi:hypothetical protein
MAHVVVSGAQVHACPQVDEREAERLLVQDHVEGLHVAVHHAWITHRDEMSSQKKRDTAKPLMRALQSVAKTKSLQGLASVATLCCHITRGAYDLYGEQPTRQVDAVTTSFLTGAGRQHSSLGPTSQLRQSTVTAGFPYGLTCCVSQIVSDALIWISSPFKREEALAEQLAFQLQIAAF